MSECLFHDLAPIGSCGIFIPEAWRVWICVGSFCDFSVQYPWTYPVSMTRFTRVFLSWRCLFIFFTQSTSYLKIQREKLAGYSAKPVDPQERFCLLLTQIPEFIWQFEQALLHGLRQLNAQFLVGDYVWVDLGGVALLKNVTGAGLWGFRALWHTQCALWLILVILSFLLLPPCLVVVELNHW